jgi:L-malate glycosyltransferase
MTKIAIISIMAGDPWGGSEELWAATAYSALDAGHQVGVFVYQRTTPVQQVAQIAQAGAHVFYRPLPKHDRLARLISRVQPEKKTLIHQLSQFSPEVVFISQGGTFEVSNPNSIAVCNFLHKSGIPFIIVCHRNEDSVIVGDVSQKIMRDVFSKANSVMFVAENNLKSARRQIISSIENGFIIKNPVNLTIDTPPAWPKSTILSMANVARLDVDYKGQDLFLEALSCDTWKARNWTLTFYGNGPDRDYIEHLIDFYGLNGHVHFAGYVNDVRRIWKQHHLLVLPSRREGTPLALVEAMLCARPSLVTDVGGNAEWANHEAGFIAEAASVRSLRKTLEEVWNSRDNLEVLGRTAYTQAIVRVDRDPGSTVLAHLVEAIDKGSPSEKHLELTTPI